MKYEVVPEEKIPEELSSWKELPRTSVDVRDAVVDEFTYLRIAVGPCASGKIKVIRVSAAGVRLTVTTTIDQELLTGPYSIVYLKADWEPRTKFGPQVLSLKINDTVQNFWAYDRSKSVESSLPFQPTAIYQPGEAFRCPAP